METLWNMVVTIFRWLSSTSWEIGKVLKYHEELANPRETDFQASALKSRWLSNHEYKGYGLLAQALELASQ